MISLIQSAVKQNCSWGIEEPDPVKLRRSTFSVYPSNVKAQGMAHLWDIPCRYLLCNELCGLERGEQGLAREGVGWSDKSARQKHFLAAEGIRRKELLCLNI